MKIASLSAENVHGYLPINVEFFDDLTFLIGLNGSGKTSALRLLMALLTPNIDDLGSISFSKAVATVHEGEEKYAVVAEKSSEGVTLSVVPGPSDLKLTTSELELYMEARRHEEPRSPTQDKIQAHPVFQRIRAISTPMFLGLDRRFYAPGPIQEDINEARRREMLARRYTSDDPSRSGALRALVEVNFLVVTRMQEVRAAQEQLDENLRAQFFAKAFEYKPSEIGASARLPSKVEIERYREQLTKIERAAEGVKIPVPEIQTALTHFFERMGRIVDAMDRTSQLKQSARKSGRRHNERASAALSIPDKDYIEWIINKPQADRILEHLSLLDEYIENRNALRDPITRFLSLVNSFFSQTKKLVAVAPSGHLTVALAGNPEPRPITALSSGERQLLVMIAHLSLNPNLIGSGVFIVDEPELSLHIDWQERFVDAIREANPNVQLILATHSPAIILDREAACRNLCEVAHA
ncbi:MAG: AAA family ATPase [Xanthomonadales bacterium]|nr:AAA family ATPase [Xanthomonadales bacterium]